MVGKWYMFQFINTYISNYIIAYWVRDMAALATNLVTILVFKQVGVNIAEFLQDKILIGRKIKKVKQHFEAKLSQMSAEDLIDTIAVEEVKMH